MPTTQARVKAHSLEQDGRISVRLEGPPGHKLRPGQMFAGFRPGYDWRCHTLIPIRISESGFSTHLPTGVQWPPGTTLVLRGPNGDGFLPPESGRRWLIISIGGVGGYLRPLVDLGLAQGREVAFVPDDQTYRLPPAVEVLPDPEEAVAWADYIAVGIPMGRLGELSDRLKGDAWRLRRLVQDDVLVVAAVPCGIGGCQACALEGYGRRRLLCTEGPTLRLRNLRT
jgi:hypothetical protein